MAQKFRKVTEFKTVQDFRAYLAEEGINIGLCDEVPGEGKSALAEGYELFGRRLSNRFAILPMEGWDCEDDGRPSELTRRRWLRFAESGASLLFGTEAAAVMESGRSNPQQLMATPETEASLKELCLAMRERHRELYGDEICIGLQLTHSGRYSHPHDRFKLEPRTAYAHPLLDKKYHCSEADVVSDDEIREIIKAFVQAAKVAENAGFDFIDIKHAHGYFAHELLTAIERPGPYGGSWENRTRFLREVLEAIKAECPNLHLAARLSIFDIMPFEKGEDGVGRPMAWEEGKVYPYALGGSGDGMTMDPELTETVKLVKLMEEYGVGLICATIGSPYYNVHMQRPAYYPVSDGYQMPEHPLYNVSRHLEAVRVLKKYCPEMPIVGSGYTCLQEYLPYAAEYAVKMGETDFVGIGRMVLSYPWLCADVLEGKPLNPRLICRTFGDCTSGPRNGLISGCYPLDEYYKRLPEAKILADAKRAARRGDVSQS